LETYPFFGGALDGAKNVGAKQDIESHQSQFDVDGNPPVVDDSSAIELALLILDVGDQRVDWHRNG